MLTRWYPRSPRRAIAAALCVCAGLLTAVAATADDSDRPYRLQIIGLLRAHDFDRLEEVLSKTPGPSSTIVNAPGGDIYAFGYADPTIGDDLNAWIRRKPDSAIARIARGIYYSHLAVVSRGERWASETHPTRFERMAKRFEDASRDLHVALRLKPDADVVYAELISIAQFYGDARAAKDLWSAATDVVPDSAIVYFRALDVLDPRWNGTLFIAKWAAKLTRWYFGDNPRFAGLRGREALIEARAAELEERYHDAVALLTQAIDAHESAWRYFLRATIHVQLDQTDLALADIDRALHLFPHYARALSYKSDLLSDLDRFAKALKFADQAVALDPYNPNYLLTRTRALLGPVIEGDPRPSEEELQTLTRKARIDLERALAFGAYDPLIEGRAARFYATVARDGVPDDLRRSIQSFERVLQVWPENARALNGLAQALTLSSDCRAHEIFDRYMAACGRQPGCAPQRAIRDWITERLPSCESAIATVAPDPTTGVYAELRQCWRDFESEDAETAWLRCEERAKAGNAPAQYDIGLLYLLGKHVRQSTPAAAVWWVRAARQNNADAQAALGLLMVEGVAMDQDVEEGLALIRRSAERGNANGLVALARLHIDGTGVPRDLPTAKALLQEAMSKGSASALRTYRTHFGADRS